MRSTRGAAPKLARRGSGCAHLSRCSPILVPRTSTMRLVVDADILIDVFRDVTPAIDLIAAARRRGEDFISVPPVRTEVLRGASPRSLSAVEAFLSTLRWLDVDVDLADRAGEIGRPFQR